MKKGHSQQTVLIDDVDVQYGRGTLPQGPLPFHIRMRRLHPWWPGSERHGKVIDWILLACLLAPVIALASYFFGWMPVAFVIAEIVLIRLTIYRMLFGTFLD